MESRNFEIKHVPAEAEVRARVRAEAQRTTVGLDRGRPLKRHALEEMAHDVLRRTGLGISHLGFAMVAVSNSFWQEQFAAIPFTHRLLLLPHCLRKANLCRGTYSARGLSCAECGACILSTLKREAESLGYHVLIAEGTPAVVEEVLSGKAEAILGVACLDSLEKAFRRLKEVGIPHIAVPLLKDGCADTETDIEVLREWIHRRNGTMAPRTRSYLPLLRAAEELFAEERLRILLGEEMSRSHTHDSKDVAPEIAFHWLRAGGKRYRPFITLASYSALAHGEDALDPHAELGNTFPEAVKRVAVAIEALHKASLVHDDIEDEDDTRYGRPTLHRQYGLPTALNVGDYLIGLGYRLVSSAQEEFGPECTVEILDHLSEAHLKLCRGQGADLLLREQNLAALRSRDIQIIYALKTAPAFEAAFYVGIRMGEERRRSEYSGPSSPRSAISRLSRFLGVAYQVQNDLKEWRDEAQAALPDELARRPTILHAFLMEAPELRKEELFKLLSNSLSDAAKVSYLRKQFEAHGVFSKAERFIERCRERASAEADNISPESLRELMHFVLETVL